MQADLATQMRDNLIRMYIDRYRTPNSPCC